MDNNSESAKTQLIEQRVDSILQVIVKYSLLEHFLSGALFTLGALTILFIVGIFMFYFGLGILTTITSSFNHPSQTQQLQNFGY